MTNTAPLEESAFATLREELVFSHRDTPNFFEAEKLAEMKITSMPLKGRLKISDGR